MINGKIVVHVRAPLTTQSGYGAQSREIVDYLLSQDKFIVAAETTNWGNCGYIPADHPRMKDYYQCILHYEKLKDQPDAFDISIYVTIPNEFERRAPLCILHTAGIEVDRVAREWIHKCNEADMIVVPSQHSAKVLAGTVYTLVDERTGEKVDERLTRPLFVIPEFFSRPENIEPLDVSFSTKKNFLCVGQWGGKGGFDEDRKNIATLIRTFLEQFKDDPNAGLILKVQLVNGSSRDKTEVVRRIREIKSNFKDPKCKIHLLHQELTDAQMWSLYSHPQVTGFISFTHGEGFCRPALEASAAGKPVLATNWSGHIDFLREKHGFIPLAFELKDVPECQVWPGVITKDSRWASVDLEDAKKKMRKFLRSSTPIEKQAVKNIEWLDQNFSRQAVYSKWDEFFSQFVKESTDTPPNAEPEIAQYNAQKSRVADQLRSKIEQSDKKKVLYIMPQSAGDCLISTSIINSLILNRHWDTDFDFYVATTEPFKPLFSRLERELGLKVIDYDHQLMFNAEITREVFDYVYHPGVNVQYQFSNWLLGNGEYSVKLLEEFAKNCNIHPGEVRNYKVDFQECDIPTGPYVVIAPNGSKQSKTYKYWPDVVHNLKKMIDNVEIVQVGTSNEPLLDGVLDYRGKTFAESFFVIKNSAAVLSADSFPAHAAAAMEVPHLVIYGNTHAHTCAPTMVRKKVPQLAIESSVCEPKCYKDRCSKMKDGKNCLSHIRPQTICETFKRLIEMEQEELDGE